MHENRFARMMGSLLVALLIGACGSDDRSSEFVKTPAPVTPAIIAFGADPSTIDAGDPVTLGWRTKEAEELAIVDGSGTAISLGDAPVDQGSVVVHPPATTSYTLTATGPDAGVPPASRTVIVTVREPAPAPPAVVEFKATPAEAAVGAGVTLSWKTTGATQVAIKDDAGHAVDPGNAAAAEGQVTVEPTRSPTVYVLTADGPGGRETAEVSVAVTGLPRVVRFDVSPITTIDVGGSVTLSWATSNAASVVIEQDGRPLDVSPTEFTSSRTIVLTESAVFTLVATSAAGTAEARVEARVGPRIMAFSSTEQQVREGDRVTLTWQLADATRATIEGPGGYNRLIEGAELISGSDTWNVTQGGQLVLRAFRGEVSRTAAIAIDVTGAPRVRSLTVDRHQFTAVFDRPESVTLAWKQDGADTCTVYRANVPVPGLDGFSCNVTGTAEVPVFNTGTLRLEARNTDGVHAASVGIEAVQRAVVDVFTATPNRRLTPGAPVELSWSVFGGASVSMKKEQLPFAVDSSALTGSAPDFVDEDTIYTLTALNPLGYPTEAQLLVRAGDPELLSAEVEPSFVAIGDEFIVRWTADGGDILAVTKVGETVPDHTTEEWEEIDDGAATLIAPSVAGSHVYTVRVENDLGARSDLTVEITASDGPIIESFTVNRAGVSRGEYVSIAWEVRNDWEDETPSLSLTDSRGNDYATQMAARDPNSDELAIKLDEEGEYRFFLTARTTDGRMEHTRQVDVEVTTAAVISEFVATPDRFDTEEGALEPEIELSWRIQDGVELEIFEVDAEGEPIGNALLWVSTALGGDQTRIDEGSLTVYPTATTQYLARVRNRVGSAVEETVLVVIDPPELLTLYAEPEDIIYGESARLHWTSARATEIRLAPTVAGLTRLGNTYVDISPAGTGTGTYLATVTGTTGRDTIDFPEGFVFPFEGVDRTAIQVATYGWAGFNLTNTSTTSAVGTLPQAASTTRYVSFAVFNGYHNNTLNSLGGKLYYGLHTDDLGESFIIQWTNWSWATASYNESNLNFQLVLRPNGDFEYRYGTMTAVGVGRADGVGAYIGFQFPSSGSAGMMAVPYNTAVPGGLANTGFAFHLDLPLDGSTGVTPLANTTYEVTAATSATTDSMKATVKVWKEPEFTSITLDPMDPETLSPFEIAWAATNATRVRLLDRSGNELFATEKTGEIEKGSYKLTEPISGYMRYTLEAINGIDRNTVTRELGFWVFDRLRIDDLEATPSQFVTAGTNVTIEWATTGAEEVYLFACLPETNLGDCTNVTPPNPNPNGGTYTARANQSMEYVLEILAGGRGASRVLGVWVGAGTLDSFAATKTQLLKGGSTTLSWTSSGQKSAVLEPYEPVFSEVTAAAPFIDISGTGTNATLNREGSHDIGRWRIPFPDGFVFPFGGKHHKAIQVAVDGWAGFDLKNTANSTAPGKLGGTNTYRYENFALFVGDLAMERHAPNGQLFYGRHTDDLGDCFIIQWKDWGWYNNTDRGSSQSLNFELVLRPTGAFEYRYGTMTAALDWARGNGATIGFQYPAAGSYGAMLAPAQTVVEGGLQNRSWRVQAGFAPSGSIEVSPTESTTYKLCTSNASMYRDCEEIRVVVIQAGDLLFSELMFAPNALDAQWIELRNMSPDKIDLEGWMLASGTGSHTLPSLVVEPDAYVVLARSDDLSLNGGLSPIAHSYGDNLTLNTTAGSAVLTFGALEVDRVTWTGAWNKPINHTIAVDPGLMKREVSCNDAMTAWCEITTPYGDGMYGGSPGENGPGCGE